MPSRYRLHPSGYNRQSDRPVHFFCGWVLHGGPKTAYKIKYTILLQPFKIKSNGFQENFILLHCNDMVWAYWTLCAVFGPPCTRDLEVLICRLNRVSHDHTHRWPMKRSSCGTWDRRRSTAAFPQVLYQLADTRVLPAVRPPAYTRGMD